MLSSCVSPEWGGASLSTPRTKFADFIATGEKFFALEWQTDKIDRISNPEIKDLFDSDGTIQSAEILIIYGKVCLQSSTKKFNPTFQDSYTTRYWFQLADLIIDDAFEAKPVELTGKPTKITTRNRPL